MIKVCIYALLFVLVQQQLSVFASEAVYLGFHSQHGGDQSSLYHEKWRPGYHFSPPKNWMNDPNGLVYVNGEYHQFYQYNPYGAEWGWMSWGHAVSTDLVHWTNLPIAIPNYDGINIYSGCIVIDTNNTSGLCNSTFKDCMVAFYTANSEYGEAQAIAYSSDYGRTFTEYAKNPIIELDKQAFQDPKVFWYAPGKKWIMVTALCDIYQLMLFSSTNLINWTHIQTFGPAGSQQGIWEDPDLFPLTDENGKEWWVLTHSVGVRNVEYYIGTFDGNTFVNANPTDQTLFFDYGRDFDEAASYNNEPKGRRLMMAWMSDSTYSYSVPTSPWRGVHTMIRELTLRTYPEGIRVVQSPIEELTTLRYSPTSYMNVQLTEADSEKTLSVKGNQVEMIINIAFPTSNIPSEFGVKVFAGPNQETVIGYNVEMQQLFVDRTQSGYVNLTPDFPCVTAQTMLPEDGVIQMQIFIDQSSVEVFGNRGKIAMTNLVFPDPTQNSIVLYTVGGDVTFTSVNTWLLNGIWPAAGTAEHLAEQMLEI